MAGIGTTIEDRIATVTIDNPTKRNALTVAMWQELPRVYAALTADDAVRVIVLTGAGEHFSAGADIAALELLGTGQLPTVAEMAIRDCPKPTIAAINGICFGGGCELAAACDLRIAGTGARFSVPPANLGVVYPLPATQLLVSVIGPAATKYLMFTGEPIDAIRALHIGLVDEVVAPELLRDRGQALAARIASRSQLTVQAAKEIVNAIASGQEPAALAALAGDWSAQAMAGPDLAEGMRAFAEKRPAQFTWHRPHG
ncbi:enoyl-CoA hydratase/isomerase family protein [Granulicoccus phenolivorans]|uniref:enoyl-CoA hydratase/isomerase family protein n=1 Tax=Granulicoccus phenolivorans TaxID=266854 RepID=UPI0003F8EE2B|nr:enoyl-CoA hydratase/isomerase family protein [Granulicoccus phenolivorans]